MLTQAFTDAIAETEKIITDAPHVRTDQDLREGYAYLAGSIQVALRMAWAYDPDFPSLVMSTGPYTKLGLDNPDTLYFHADIRDDAEYVLIGRRGTTRDLSFQLLNGSYSPVDVPDGSTAFDDREIDVAADGSFELRFGPDPAEGRRNYVRLGEGAAILLVREVYGDWATERRGVVRLHRVGALGASPPVPAEDKTQRRYEVAGRMLINQVKTFLAFPEWFYLNLPVNTMTEPRQTPGGLSTQFSAVGHYELADDQALVVTVPVSDAPYQGIQLGSRWYVSLDYINHQTSLNADQARPDPDGKFRFVISERDPGLANWLERAGHERGYVQIRWQRLSRDLTPDDGPQVDIVPVADLPDTLPYYAEQRVTPAEWAARIAARQAAVADRMLG